MKKAPREVGTSRTGKALSWWRKLGKGPKWLAVTVTPLILAAAIPGIAPWVVDRTRDLFGEEPLTASGENYPELVAGSYLAIDSVLTVPAEDGYSAVVGRGGVQMGTSGHKITLSSNRSGSVYIEKITAVVEKRRSALAGTAYIGDPQGSADAALVEFFLDSSAGAEIPAMIAESFDEPGKSAPYLADGTVRYVEQGKPEYLIILAHATRCYCQWRVRIDYSYRGEKAQLVVPPPGEDPFSTTAWTMHKVQYTYSLENSEPLRHDCVAESTSCRGKR